MNTVAWPHLKLLESPMPPDTLTLYPYLIDRSCWVFDVERTGLTEEAFVLGESEMITVIVHHKAIPDAERGFALPLSRLFERSRS